MTQNIEQYVVHFNLHSGIDEFNDLTYIIRERDPIYAIYETLIALGIYSSDVGFDPKTAYLAECMRECYSPNESFAVEIYGVSIIRADTGRLGRISLYSPNGE